MMRSDSRRAGLLILIFLFLFSPAGKLLAQNEDSLMTDGRKWEMKGYLKDMLSVTHIPDLDSTLVDNLLHNRVNFHWFPSEKFSFNLEVRNRILKGNLVKGLYPFYSDIIDAGNDYFKLSWIPVDRQEILIHTMIDRAWITLNPGEWEIRLGRQRINWGTNLAWNPNDWFNAYNFLDFDYEERPGSDAIRVTRYIGFASSLEFAAKMADHVDEEVAAFLYKFNRKGYDIQVLSGIVQGSVAVGTGWAGNIKNAGFKGEISWFHPYRNFADSTSSLTGAISADYSFQNSFYLLGSYLYNSNGLNSLPANAAFLGSTQILSAKNLMPFRHSTLIMTSYTPHPLVSTGLSIMMFPGDNALFLNPTLGFSLRENLDLGLFGQFFLNESAFGKYGLRSNSGFVRIKWSF